MQLHPIRHIRVFLPVGGEISFYPLFASVLRAPNRNGRASAYADVGSEPKTPATKAAKSK